MEENECEIYLQGAAIRCHAKVAIPSDDQLPTLCPDCVEIIEQCICCKKEKL